MCCIPWSVKDIEYEPAPKYQNTTAGYRYQWNGQSWDLQQIQVPTVSSYRYCLSSANDWAVQLFRLVSPCSMEVTGDYSLKCVQ